MNTAQEENNKNNIKKLKPLVIGDLKINIPIIQGGMGVRISGSSLASSVSNEGALGVIASVGLGEEDKYLKANMDYIERSKQALRDMIRETKLKTSKPFGVNIMYALTNYDDLVQVCVEEDVDIIFSGAGLPLKLPFLTKKHDIKLVPIVSSARATDLLIRCWLHRYKKIPDAIVVEGPLAGGHLGFSMEYLNDIYAKGHNTLLAILTEIKKIVKKYATKFKKIPIIVAGGIFNGKDIAFYLKNGADGVQIATRFICTDECDVDVSVKNLIVNSKKEDIVLINSPVGMPGVAIMNEFVKKILNGQKIPFSCKYKCLKSCDPEKVKYCIADALVNAYKGNIKNGFVMGGFNSYRVNKIVNVKNLINKLKQEALSDLASIKTMT